MMTYLVGVAVLGTAAVFFLWLRDSRIFLRSGLIGFRKASYQGVIFCAIALLGFFFAAYGLELVGLGFILGALYLQGRVKREPVWTNEGTIQRLLGSCRCKKDKVKKKHNIGVF